MSRLTHDRTALHTGTEADVVEVLADAIGTLPAGTDLHTVLAYIHNQILSLETYPPTVFEFTIDSILRRSASGSFTIDAFIGSHGGTFTIDAMKRRIVSGSFAEDAVIKKSVSGSWTIDADIEKGFTIDAVLKSSGLTTLQWRSFDRTMTDSNVLPNSPTIKIYKRDHFR